MNLGSVLFNLRQLLPTLFMPLITSILLVVFGLIRGRRFWAFAGMALLVLASLPAVSNALRSSLERQYPHMTLADCPTADAVVPLSGFAAERRVFMGEIEFDDAVDRLESATMLIRMQKAPLLLFTDPDASGGGVHSSLAELVALAAVQHGVPRDKIGITKRVATTADEAQAVKEYLEVHGGKRIILVSSAMHMRRAALLFRNKGVEVVPFPVDYLPEDHGATVRLFWPGPSSLAQTQQALHEMYGNVVLWFANQFDRIRTHQK